MNTDFRVAIGLPDHPKTIKLRRLIGPAACEVLLRLFGFTAVNRPSGDLSGMDDDTIAIAAGGQDAPPDLVPHLVKAGFLEGRRGRRHIHDWASHNPYAATAESRVAKARNAALARWGSKRQDDPTDDDLKTVLSDATSNATSINEQCPSVSSVSSVTNEERTTTGSVQHNGAAPPPKGSPSPVAGDGPPGPSPLQDAGFASDREEAVALLAEQNVGESDALRLIRLKGLPAIKGQILWLPYRLGEGEARGKPCKAPHLWLIRSIEESWPIPQSYTAEVESRKRTAEGFAEAKARQDAEKAKRKRDEQVNAYFEAMPVEKQAKVDTWVIAAIRKIPDSGEALAEQAKGALVKLAAGELVGVGILSVIRGKRRELLDPKVPADWQPPAIDPNPPPETDPGKIEAAKKAVQEMVKAASPSNVHIERGLVKSMP